MNQPTPENTFRIYSPKRDAGYVALVITESDANAFASDGCLPVDTEDDLKEALIEAGFGLKSYSVMFGVTARLFVTVEVDDCTDKVEAQDEALRALRDKLAPYQDSPGIAASFDSLVDWTCLSTQLAEEDE